MYREVSIPLAEFGSDNGGEMDALVGKEIFTDICERRWQPGVK